MPPKIKYNENEIIEAAYNIVRKNGTSALTARSLAAELGTSTAPIFTAFKNMEQVLELVTKKAETLYKHYIEKALLAPLPFKECGLKYIQFALDEPLLFKMLFMKEKAFSQYTHYFPADPMAPTVLNIAKTQYNIDEEKVRKLYNHLSVYVHGLAVLCAQGSLVFTMKDMEAMLSEVFVALKKNLEE